MSNDQFGQPSREHIQHRADRRWVWLLVAIAVVVPPATLLLNSTILRPEHPASGAHRPPAMWAFVIMLVTTLVGFGVGALVIRRARRRPGSMFAAPLAAGLPRSQRRSAMRNIRHGTPSSDPEQALIEREVAAETVRASRRSVGIFTVCLILELLLSFMQHTTPSRLFYGAGVVLFGSMFGATLVQLRGARTYLARTTGDRDMTPS